MKPVRFTDLERRKVPYVRAAETDIRATFARIKRERQRSAAVEGWPEPAVPEWKPAAQSWAQLVRVD